MYHLWAGRAAFIFREFLRHNFPDVRTGQLGFFAAVDIFNEIYQPNFIEFVSSLDCQEKTADQSFAFSAASKYYQHTLQLPD